METFYQQVYAMVARIPKGRVATYGQIAMLLGLPHAARAVGQALAHAPIGLPCHRVVNRQGRIASGWEEQRRLLQAEGIDMLENGCVCMDDRVRYVP